jgi:sterol 3beta-glucosyltransferase
LSKPIGEFRTKFDLPKTFSLPTVRNIYGISSFFLSTPQDFPTYSKFTGFWFGTSSIDLTKDLTDFINAGEPPLLLTFGSMPFKSKFNLQSAIVKLTDQFNIRMIVVKGWGLDQTEQLENNSNIKVIESAPYEKLFPLMKAIVHHGGIGTTAECLRAGKPFLICPILYPIGDQMFWGKHAYKKELAVKPVPISKMTEKIFLESIKELLTNKSLYQNARHIGELLKTENSIENTIMEIERITLR